MRRGYVVAVSRRFQQRSVYKVREGEYTTGITGATDARLFHGCLHFIEYFPELLHLTFQLVILGRECPVLLKIIRESFDTYVTQIYRGKDRKTDTERHKREREIYASFKQTVRWLDGVLSPVNHKGKQTVSVTAATRNDTTNKRNEHIKEKTI